MSRQKTIASSSSGKSFLIVLTTTLLLLVSCGPSIQALLFLPGSDVSLARESSTADNQEEDADIAKVSAVYEAVIPICKIHVAFCCSFIRTFSFIEKVITPEGSAVPIPQSSYFRILFRQIISPNAP